jgi:hypothetical protein
MFAHVCQMNSALDTARLSGQRTHADGLNYFMGPSTLCTSLVHTAAHLCECNSGYFAQTCVSQDYLSCSVQPRCSCLHREGANDECNSCSKFTWQIQAGLHAFRCFLPLLTHSSQCVLYTQVHTHCKQHTWWCCCRGLRRSRLSQCGECQSAGGLESTV